MQNRLTRSRAALGLALSAAALVTTAAADSLASAPSAPQSSPSGQQSFDAEAFAREGATRLAQVRAALRIDRDHAAASKALDQLWSEACRGLDSLPASFVPTETLEQLLRELVLQRAAVCQATGRPEAAEALLRDPLGAHGGAIGLKQARSWHAAWKFERSELLALLSTLAAQQDGARSEVGQDVEQLALDLIRDRNWSAVEQLGARAVPGLEATLRTSLDEYPEKFQTDYYYWLVIVSEGKAAEFALQTLRGGGTLWRGRILRAMREAHVIPRGSGPAWEESRFPNRLRLPLWADVLDQLYAYPDVAAEALSTAEPLLGHGLASPALVAALSAAVKGSDLELRSTALRVAHVELPVPGLWTVFDSALAHPDPDVRRFAADRLLTIYEDVSGLLALEHDSEPDLRRRVAEGAKPRRCLTINEQGNVAALQLDFKVDEATRAALLRLLADEDWQVRLASLEALTPVIESLDDATLERLARDESLGVRKQMAHLPQYLRSPERVARALMGLAADPHPEVVGTMLEPLRKAVDWSVDCVPYLPLLGRLLENPAIDRSRVREMLERATRDGEAQSALVLWSATVGDPTLVVGDRDVERDGAWSQTTWIFQLPADSMVPWIQLLHHQDLHACAGMMRGAFLYGHGLQESGRRLFELRSAPTSLRFFGASLMAGADDGAALTSMIESQVEGLNELAQQSWILDYLQILMKHSRFQGKGRLALAALKTPGLRDELVLGLCRYFPAEEPESPAILRAIVERWLSLEQPNEEQNRVLVAALEVAPLYPDALEPEVWVLAARRGRLAQAAFSGMGKLCRPEHLPFLREQLAVQPGSERWKLAAATLGNYLTDEAAELLLQAAGQPISESLRADLLTKLEAIRTYQDARERWSQRRLSTNSRAEAVARLLMLVDSQDSLQRCEAIRALATLGGVEALPRLVELLLDPDAQVAAAARAALERLNREAPAGDRK